MATQEETDELAQLLLGSGHTNEEISTTARHSPSEQLASTSSDVQQGDVLNAWEVTNGEVHINVPREGHLLTV